MNFRVLSRLHKIKNLVIRVCLAVDSNSIKSLAINTIQFKIRLTCLSEHMVAVRPSWNFSPSKVVDRINNILLTVSAERTVAVALYTQTWIDDWVVVDTFISRLVQFTACCCWVRAKSPGVPDTSFPKISKIC